MTTPYPTEDDPARDAGTAGPASNQPDHVAHDDTAATASGVTGQSPESTEPETESGAATEAAAAPAPAPAPGEAVTEHIAVSAAQSPGSETAETIRLDGVAVTERLGASSTARLETRDVHETAESGEPGEPGETGDIRESGKTWETWETKETGGTREAGDTRETGEIRESTRFDADGSGYADHDRSGAPRAEEQTSAAPTTSYPAVTAQGAAPEAAPATGTGTAPSVASPAHESPRRRGARMGTVVWGILLAAIGAGIVARGLGVDFDVELALIIVLSVMGGALLVGSVVAGIRRT